MLPLFFPGTDIGQLLAGPTVIPPATNIGTLLRRVSWLDNASIEDLYGAWVYDSTDIIPDPLPNTPDFTAAANATSMDFGPYPDGSSKLIYIGAGLDLGGGSYLWSDQDGITVTFVVTTLASAPTISSLVVNPSQPTTQLNLAWSWPHDENTIQQFRIRYRVNGSGDPWTEVTRGKSERSDTLVGLVAGTTYEVQVGAENTVGTAYSSSSTATTTGATTPTAPTFHSVNWTGSDWDLSFTQNDAGSVQVFPEYRVSPSTTWLTPTVSLRLNYTTGGPQLWADLWTPPTPSGGETWEWRMRVKRDGLFSAYSGTVSDTI